MLVDEFTFRGVSVAHPQAVTIESLTRYAAAVVADTGSDGSESRNAPVVSSAVTLNW